MLKCFGFFNASIANLYVLEFLGRKHLNVLLEQVFYAEEE